MAVLGVYSTKDNCNIEGRESDTAGVFPETKQESIPELQYDCLFFFTNLTSGIG